jgi:hypothetical protein
MHKELADECAVGGSGAESLIDALLLALLSADTSGELCDSHDSLREVVADALLSVQRISMILAGSSRLLLFR